MKAILIMSLAALALPAQADVFKCTDPQTRRTLYQPKPCADAAVEQRIEMKYRSAEEEAVAAARLRNWQARQAEEQALKEKIAKERWEAQLKAAEVEAAQRNVATQQELIRTQKRLADEMRNRPVAVPFPVQSDIFPARAGTNAIQTGRGGTQGPATVSVQPAASPSRFGAGTTHSSRWGTQTGR